MKRPIGRPTDLTPKMSAAICDLVRAGNYRSTAARAVGIRRETLAAWLDRGLTGEEPFASFSRALDTAEAEGEVALVALVRTDSSLETLARRYSQRWRKKDNISARVELHTDLPKEKLLALAEQTAAEVALLVAKVKAEADE